MDELNLAENIGVIKTDLKYIREDNVEIKSGIKAMWNRFDEFRSANDDEHRTLKDEFEDKIQTINKKVYYLFGTLGGVGLIATLINIIDDVFIKK